MVEEKLEAEQDRFKSGEEELSIRMLRLLEESTILKLLFKGEPKDVFLFEAKGNLIIREETRRSLIYRLICLRRLLLILLK